MPFSAQRVSRTQVIQLSALPGRVFPLFEPVGEQAWAVDWEPTWLFPASGAAEAGAVFTTRHPGEADTIWILITYEPATFHLAYLRVTPGSRVGLVNIRCEEAPDGATRAAITYTFTALSEAGNAFLASFTADHYREYMAAWEMALNHYLRTGEPLRHH